VRRMLLIGAMAGGVLLAAPPAAGAHPLGNFTVNVYAGIIVRSEEVLVDYVVDMAEIPAYQERAAMDTSDDGSIDGTEGAAYRDATCSRLAAGLSLSVDGSRAGLSPTASSLSFPAGSGGLSTVRLECRLSVAFTARDTPAALAFVDGNHAGRIGWREVTAVGDGTTLVASDVPARSASRRLTAYPGEGLPLAVHQAAIEAVAGGPRLPELPGPGREAVTSSESGRDIGVLATLAGRADLSAGVVALMFAVALGVGAVHALGPGHGKGLIGAYLVGGGGAMRQAVGVGAAVAVMHTASVLGLGLLVATAERILPAERIYPWLGLASGLVALALGSWLMVARIHAAGWHRTQRGSEHPHDHEHPHPHADAPLSRRGLIALAFAGGILPSPSALVVLLTSISLGRAELGLGLIATFSIGLAGTLIGVGALALKLRSVTADRLPTRIMGWAPVASGATIAVIGVVLTTRGLVQL
jgi:nickel/cobalt exporter